MLRLRLRADSLIHTHSSLNRVVPKKLQAASKPDTYYEVSRPSTSASSSSPSGAWIVVYRSPPVKESVSPAYDEAAIELASLGCRCDGGDGEEDMSAFPVMITVYKVKKRKCKAIGEIETNIESLMSASQTAERKGDEDESCGSTTYDDGDEEAIGTAATKTFQLRPNATGGSDRSNEVRGNLTVVAASITSSDDMRERSQRFLSGSEGDDENDVGDGEISFCAMSGDSRDVPTDLRYDPPASRRPKFADYVRAGTVDVDFCVAIDFTSSNGDPRIPGSQHYSRFVLKSISWICSC